MVRNSTSVQAFTIREALNLCEIAEYERAGSLLPSPDLDSSDPELLFAWGVILSGQSQQELAKDLLSKASRLLDKEPAELARIYLALCYWRLGEISEALVLLGIEPEGTEAQFFCLLVRAIIETEQGNSHAALALLARVNLADLSDAKCGKFHNHRGLALRKLGKLDEAIQEFERAINYWKDAPELLALAKNNLSRAYSLTGKLEQALDNVNAAISLTTSRQRLGQFHDQKSRIYLDHALPDSAKIESARAVFLLRGTEREDFLVEALATQNALPLSPLTPDKAVHMSLTLERATELVDIVTTENDAEHAWELLELMARTSDPQNPIAQKTMRHLFTLTPEFEAEFDRQMKRFLSPDASSQAEH